MHHECQHVLPIEFDDRATHLGINERAVGSLLAPQQHRACLGTLQLTGQRLRVAGAFAEQIIQFEARKVRGRKACSSQQRGIGIDELTGRGVGQHNAVFRLLDKGAVAHVADAMQTCILRAAQRRQLDL